jgi:hypothetical protein
MNFADVGKILAMQWGCFGVGAGEAISGCPDIEKVKGQLILYVWARGLFWRRLAEEFFIFSCWAMGKNSVLNPSQHKLI